MYVKEVLFSEQSSPKHYVAEVTLDKEAIFNAMKKWLESFRDSIKDTVFSIGNFLLEPDIRNVFYYYISYDPDIVSEKDIDEVVKQMQSDWDYVIGNKILIEGGGSYVSFAKLEEEIIESISKVDALEIPDGVLLDIGFYLDMVKPEVQDVVLQRAISLEDHLER